MSATFVESENHEQIRGGCLSVLGEEGWGLESDAIHYCRTAAGHWLTTGSNRLHDKEMRLLLILSGASGWSIIKSIPQGFLMRARSEAFRARLSEMAFVVGAYCTGIELEDGANTVLLEADGSGHVQSHGLMMEEEDRLMQPKIELMIERPDSRLPSESSARRATVVRRALHGKVQAALDQDPIMGFQFANALVEALGGTDSVTLSRFWYSFVAGDSSGPSSVRESLLLSKSLADPSP
ncbi:MAG: hypothetical protein NT069_01230 [Planctomycetota bacterium]|nr:hypothetical protein [Planctomycetota bacterium]